jgi:Uma2 family endonuclease
MPKAQAQPGSRGAGELEVRDMSSVPVLNAAPSGGSLVIDGIDWKTYSRLLTIFAERPSVRLTYDQGRLEIMSPVLEHDDEGRFLGQLVWVLTEELEMPLHPGGSTTLRRKLKARGIEADECFWIANAHRLKGRRRLDLRIDPPPDLAIEVDVTHSCMDRLGIHAVLGVAEVWRLDGDVLTFHVLGPRSKYTIAERSRTFPLVTPKDLMQFLHQARQAGDQNPVIRRFRQWLRQRLRSQK